MRLFSHACKPSDIDLTPESDIEQEVIIPMQSGKEILPITRLGLEHAQESLRTVGCMILSGDETENPQFTRNILIAQNHHYQVKMKLHAGVFKLYLYHIEDVLLNDINTNGKAIPITVVSHTCHRLDRMVEEIHTDHTVHNKLQGRVHGMIKLANSLLRESMPLASVKSIAAIPDDTMYMHMTNVDIVASLAGLKLQHDNTSVIEKLNKAYGGPFVKYTNANELRTNQENDEKQPVNFILEPSMCLKHAIAHQNKPLAGKLNGMGWDMDQISTALYSGISYCESCPYPNIYEYEIGFVNETDFPTTQRSIIKEIIDRNKKEMFNHSDLWEPVRHNFTTNDGENDRIVECKITQESLLLFRRKGMSIGVYAIPGTYKEPAQESISSNPQPIIKTPNQYSKSSHQHSTSRHSKRVIASMKQIGNKCVDCRTSLLHNATEMLYYINLICMHNPPVPSGKTDIHKLLRDAWLVTHMIYAANICKGPGNSEFYMIFSHLQNLKSLPFNSVGFWSTVPYV
jgi:hypothetical protein